MGRMRSLSVWAVLATGLAVCDARALTVADPLKLQVADRQTPQWDLYASLGILTAPYNTGYFDPVTFIPIRKITSAIMPSPIGSNSFVVNDYSEGGPYISREWGNQEHTLLLRTGPSVYLADYRRGIGASNYRAFNTAQPYPRYGQTSAFTSNASEPARIMFFVDTTSGNRPKLFRFNTQTMSREADAAIPMNGLEFLTLPVDSTANWMQASKDDKWLVFKVCRGLGCVAPAEFVVAFNHQTGAYYVKTCYAGAPINPTDTFTCTGDIRTGGLDEPHIDRDGRYVALLDGGGNADRLNGDCLPRNPAGQRDDRYAEAYWHLWDLNNPTVAPVCTRDIYSGHHAWTKGVMVSFDGSPNPAFNFAYTPATGVITETAYYADPSVAFPNRYAFIASHRAGQWIQAAVGETQWYWGDNTNDGDASAVAWTVYSGNIYQTLVNWGDVYQKPTIGIRAVYQADPNDSNRLRYTLAPKASVGAVTQGSYFYDSAAGRLYVWAQNGGDPGTRVSIYAPTAIHRGIGVGRVNGTDLRLLCHNYVWHGGDYTDNPFSTTSPDGKLVMFHSNMGKRSSRWDVFIAEVPVTTVGGGGCDSPMPPPECD